LRSPSNINAIKVRSQRSEQTGAFWKWELKNQDDHRRLHQRCYKFQTLSTLTTPRRLYQHLNTVSPAIMTKLSHLVGLSPSLPFKRCLYSKITQLYRFLINYNSKLKFKKIGTITITTLKIKVLPTKSCSEIWVTWQLEIVLLTV